MSETPRTQSEAETYQRLRAHLAFLKLTDAAEALPRVLDEARAERTDLVDGPGTLSASRSAATEDRRLTSRLRFACLPEPWRLADFDFSAQPGVDETLIRDLATLRFLDDAANVLVRRPARRRQDHARRRPGPRRVDAGHRVYFTTAADLAATLPQSRHRRTLGHLHALLRRPPTPGESTSLATSRCPPTAPPPCSR